MDLKNQLAESHLTFFQTFKDLILHSGIYQASFDLIATLPEPMKFLCLVKLLRQKVR